MSAAADDKRARFHARLLDAVGEGVVATDPGGRITYWNRAAERLYGWTSEEALGRPLSERAPATPRHATPAEVGAIVAAGGTWCGESGVRRRDGSTVVVFMTESPILDEHGAVVGIIATSADLSDLKRLEAELRHAQKMEAVGRLAGGVAHDFNNILTAIGGSADFLAEGLGARHPLRDDVLSIRASVKRASALTRQLLAFSRKQIPQARVVDVTAIVTEMRPMLRRLIGEDIQLTIDTPPGPAPIWADPIEIEQIVMNLVVNAIDAMLSGGRVAITVRIETGAPARLITGTYVVLTVADTGSGIAPEVLPHIFEPFYTTKQPGRGTGLGLSTVYGIVTQAGGDIEVESRPGGGTTFRVVLPWVRFAPTGASSIVRGRPASGAGETILLVEDDPAVRLVTRRALERDGYVVIEAGAPSEALKKLAPGGPHIDLLVTDLVLPQMSGPELAERIGQEAGELPTLFMSGYTPEEVFRKGIVIPEARFLAKPFSIEDLLTQVRDALDAHARRVPPPKPESLRLSGCTALVVEDDADVRRHIRRTLEAEGCGVIEAVTAHEARISLEHAQPDVVIMDLVLPGMEGREAANLILARVPDVPILYISGYTSTESLRVGKPSERDGFLDKPFEAAELVAAVTRLLEGGSARDG